MNPTFFAAKRPRGRSSMTRTLPALALAAATLAVLVACTAREPFTVRAADVSQDDLCVILQTDVGDTFASTVVFRAIDDPLGPGRLGCAVADEKDGDPRLRLILADGDSEMSDTIANYESLASRDECELVDASLDAETESALTCNGVHDLSQFFYAGFFGSTSLYFNASRPSDMGAISVGDAQHLLDTVASRLTEAAQ